MPIQYNERLKEEILEEMKRVSSIYRIPKHPSIWMNKEAEEYHKTMYRVLELMVHCPISIGIGDDYEK